MTDEPQIPNPPQSQTPTASSYPSASNATSGTIQFSFPAGAMPGQSLVFGQPFGAVVGTRQSAVIQNWVGPYPPPDAIERYEQIMPGTFNRILSMAERMEAAQIAQSSEAIRYQANDTRRAHYLGAGLGAFAIGGAMVIGFKGQPWLAAVFLAVPVMGLARAFVEGWRGAAVATSAANTPSTDAKPDAPKPGS